MWKCIVLCVALLWSCNSASRQIDAKLDAPLRKELSAREEGDRGEPIRVIGKCQRAIDAEIRRAVEKTGVSVETVTGDIFTASGSPEQVRTLAQLEIVTHLQLSVKRRF